MRYGILFLTLVVALATMALTGCAHMAHEDPESGLEVSYTGSSRGAVELIKAAHDNGGQALELAGEAVDQGMSTSVHITSDGDVTVQTGYGYTPSYGYGGYVVSSPSSPLPTLATTTVVGVDFVQADGSIVSCPTDRVRLTLAEQAACNEEAINALYRSGGR